MDKQTEQSLLVESRRRYYREYMRRYRKENKEKIKQHQENFWLRQGLRQAEAYSIPRLEQELEQLKQRA